jgi:hypothetical protein
MAKAKIGEVFKPHQSVPVSGIYTVIHDPVHAQQHDVTCIEGKPFPPCGGCKGEHPRFKLKTPAQHITKHPSFR